MIYLIFQKGCLVILCQYLGSVAQIKRHFLIDITIVYYLYIIFKTRELL